MEVQNCAQEYFVIKANSKSTTNDNLFSKQKFSLKSAEKFCKAKQNLTV